MTPDEYQAVSRRSLSAPSLANQLQASEVAPGSGVWVARDASALQHLLVQVPDGSDLDISGMTASASQYPGIAYPSTEDATYIESWRASIRLSRLPSPRLRQTSRKRPCMPSGSRWRGRRRPERVAVVLVSLIRLGCLRQMPSDCSASSGS